MTIKIACEVAGAQVPVAYDNTYVRELHAGGGERLVIGLREQHAAILRTLSALLRPPYKVLYILHTTRSGAPLGRYESPALDRAALEQLLDAYGAYFAGDARHDVWLQSRDDGGPLVLDRCNLVYAYGPLERYERVLQEMAIRAVAAWARPRVPAAHALHDHEVWDTQERALLATVEWRCTALRPEDVQFWSGPQAS